MRNGTRRPTFRIGALVVVAVVVAAVSDVAAARPFVVRATAKVQQLGDFNITRNPTLEGAVDVFEEPDACTLRTWFASAVWRAHGFRLWLTTLGVVPRGQTFCTYPQVRIDRAVVTGRRWHTPRGLAIGDSFSKLRRLYPRTRRFHFGWGIANVYERCVIGTCPTPYHWVTRLAAVIRNGRVAAFVLPVGAQGE